jgi:adhesin transport system outer membrane protein
VEEGLVGLPEQQLAQQRLETARARLAEAEQALADARETLALLIAVPVPDNLAMPPDPAAQLDASASVETDRLAASSPAVLAAREDARAARLAADAAQADKKPTIGVDLQGRAGDDIDGFKGFTNDVRARVYVRLALTDGGARDARYRAALAQAREADARARATLRDVQVDIARTGNAWTTLGALEQANARELEATRGLLDSYSAQFEANRRSLLDVFEAQDMVLNAQIRLLNSRYSRLLAGYRALAAREALVDFLVAN